MVITPSPLCFMGMGMLCLWCKSKLNGCIKLQPIYFNGLISKDILLAHAGNLCKRGKTLRVHIGNLW